MTTQCAQVTFLGVSKKFTVCQEAKSVNSKAGISFDCLEPHHFVPEVVETYPFEQLSHAVLSWVTENTESCDVIHGHEWGGSFVDLITAQHFRQVPGPPGQLRESMPGGVAAAGHCRQLLQVQPLTPAHAQLPLELTERSCSLVQHLPPLAGRSPIASAGQARAQVCCGATWGPLLEHAGPDTAANGRHLAAH